MALFRYTALSSKGKKIFGMIDAESLMDAKQKLIRRQILVTDVFLAKNQEGCSLKKKEVLALTRELSRLLGAGLPLYESLSVLEEKYRGLPAHELMLDLCDKIREGMPFSKALSAHPKCFDVLYCAMIANAQGCGHYEKVLDEMARLLEGQERVRQAVLGALLYPSLLAGFCLTVLFILLFFVVPSLFDLFEGRELHPFTRFVFAASRLALQSKWILAALFSGVAGWTGWAVFSDKGRIAAQRLLIRLPVLRELFAKAALARFFRAAATLIEGGLPALFALTEARRTLRHPSLEMALKEAVLRLSEGETLQMALQNRHIPPLVPRMLGIAQEGGNLSGMMHQIASIYEDDLERAISRITSLAQPVLLLILGAMVGFVLLSVLLPMTDVNTFAT